jgi:hypothetical protein
MPGIFDQRVTLEKMKSLLDEAAEVGKLAELVGHLGPS